MPSATAKKSAAYEKGVREGRADKMKKPKIEIEINPEGEEESEGPDKEEDMDGAASHSRKRSARGAKHTKAPMDAEGCACGGKGSKGKAACDGDCGMRKRSDALTAPEYLAACDLGIQDMPRPYIRARLDMAQRLDLKCGKGSISQGEKCTKGAATKAQQNTGNKLLQAAGVGALAAGLITASHVMDKRKYRAIDRRMQREGELEVQMLTQRNQAAAARNRVEEAVRNKKRARSKAAFKRELYRAQQSLNNFTGTSGGATVAVPGFRRITPLGTPTLEQWGEAAQRGPEALSEMMNNTNKPRRTRMKRRSRPGVVQPPRRDGFASGFTVDYDQLAV